MELYIDDISLQELQKYGTAKIEELLLQAINSIADNINHSQKDKIAYCISLKLIQDLFLTVINEKMGKCITQAIN